MKNPTPTPSLLSIVSAGVCLWFALGTSSLRAGIYFWDPNGASPVTGGTWDMLTPQWATSVTLSSALTTWNPANLAVFTAGTVDPGDTLITVNSAITTAGIYNGGNGGAVGCTNLVFAGSGSLNFTGVQGFNTAANKNTYFTVPLTGTGQFVAEGTGQIYLYANNTYSGSTALGYYGNGSPYNVVNFTNGSAFGTGPIVVAVGGGALVLNESTYPVTLANSVICTNTLNVVGNPAGLTFTGPWTLSSSATILGSGNVAGNVVTIAGIIGGSGRLIKDHAGTLVLRATNTYSGNNTISNGVFQLGDGTASGNVVGHFTNYASLVFNNPDATTISKYIVGPGNVTNLGSGVLTLTVANTYTGGTAIGAGATTKLGNASAIGKNDLFLNGTLDLGSFSPTVNGLYGAGTVDNTSNTNTYTLTVGNNNAGGNFTGTIKNTSGAVALTKTGTNTLSLGGTGAYMGLTAVNAGTLQYAAGSALSPGSPLWVPSGSTVDFQGVSGTLGGLAGSGTFSNLNGTVTVGGNAATNSSQLYQAYSGICSPLWGSGTLVKAGSHAMALRPNASRQGPLANFTGTVSLSGGTLSVGALPNLLPTMTMLTVPSGALFQLDANSQTVVSLNGSGSINLEGGTLTVNGPGTFAGVIQNSELPGASTAPGNGLRGYYYTNIDFTGLAAVRDDSTVNFPDMTFWPNYSVTAKTNQVSARWLGQVLTTLGGTYYFGTRCDDGSRLWVNGQLVVDRWQTQAPTTIIGPAGGITLAANTRYDVVLEFFNNTSGGAAGLLWAQPNSSGGNEATNTIPASNLYLPGAGTLVKSGSGTLQLTGASTYTGGTTVQGGGTLEAGAGALGTGPVTVASDNSTLQLDSPSSFNAAADLVLNGPTARVNLAFSGTGNIHGLTFDGVNYALPGTWGRSGSGAAHTSGQFTGNGILNVTASGTTTALGASSTTPVYGTPITLTATVSGAAPTPSGTVTFYDIANGGVMTNFLSTCPLVGGVATLSVSNLQVGVSHSLYAIYSGDTTHVRSTSNSVGITTSVVTLVPTINILTKVYDATNTATIGSLGGILPSDTNFVYAASGYTATFATKDVGTQTVSVSGLSLGGSLAGNYKLSSSSYTTTGTITPKALKTFGITASDKVYDGITPTAIFTTGAALAAPEAPGAGNGSDGTNFIGDNVTLVTSGVLGYFVDPNVGTAKAVTVIGLSLGGAQAGDYTLIVPALTANITKGFSFDTFTSSPNPASQGAPVLLTARLSGNPGGVPTGSVIFAAAGVAFSTNDIVSGVASTVTTALPAGTTTLAAWYVGSTNFTGATNTLSQVVNLSTCSQTNALLSVKDNGTTLTLRFKGTPQAQYSVLTNANLKAPLASWGTLPNTTTNLSDPNGLWSVTVPKNTTGQLFYRSKAANVCP